MDRIDRTKLSVSELAALEQNQFATSQIKRLRDIQDILQEIASSLLDSETSSQTSVKQMGALLSDIRETLKSLDSKETPETPDYAKPVVDSIQKLEKAFSVAIKSIDTKPQVNVAAPNVSVEPKVDLKGVEKILKDMPSAFEKAIKLIPEAKSQDYTDKFDAMLQQLQSIDTATRLKPQAPSTMKVTNPDGSVIGGVPILTERYDIQGTTIYFGQATVGTADSSTGWTIYKYLLSDLTNASGKIATDVSWDNRTIGTYS